MSTAETITSAGRAKYGAVAVSGLSNDAAGVRAVAEAFGYSPEELAAIPAGANMALSCGNPTAMANLRPGEVVVDLGSGGGIDVFLAARKVGPDVVSQKDIDPAALADVVEAAIVKLSETGCRTDEAILIDLADAFRELKYLGILGIDFDSKNVGVIKKPSPRVVLFDYGMTQSPPVDVPVVSLQGLRA